MKILIIKTGALGDVVRTSFIAQALHEKYRNSNPEIFWVTDEKAKSFFMNNPFVSKVLSKEESKKFVEKTFDIVINLEEDPENSKFASNASKSPVIGFYWDGSSVQPSESAKEWYNMSALGPKPRNDLLKKNNKKTHRQIIAEIVGVKYKKYEPYLRLTNQQRKICYDFMRRHNLSRSDLIVGINTGSADRWPKQLSIDKTINLIDIIYKKYSAKILLFGGPNEIDRNKEIISKSKVPIIDTGCGNDLLEFPALVSACSVFITSDSLGLHIALGLKRKTICLIGPTSNSEIEMYNLGYKILPKSRCLCCYRRDCKSMERMDNKDIIRYLDKLTKPKVTLVITAFKEPLSIGKALSSALNQKTSIDYKVLVSAPDKETLSVAKKYSIKDKRVILYKDPGRGKSFALNKIFNKLDSDIIILTDGDVFISENSVNEIMSLFNDPEIGCVTGRPVPVEDRKTKYGFWANFLFEAAHNLRKDAFIKNLFLECSGYLFSFRKKFIDEIPLDVAEDTVIPYYFWEKGYRIGYAEKAEVYVKNADNWDDWIKQKVRTSKAHETLQKYVDTQTTRRVKSFSTESRGVGMLFSYSSNMEEFLWSLQLALARVYMWSTVFFDTRFRKKSYNDAWERVNSTK